MTDRIIRFVYVVEETGKFDEDGVNTIFIGTSLHKAEKALQTFMKKTPALQARGYLTLERYSNNSNRAGVLQRFKATDKWVEQKP